MAATVGIILFAVFVAGSSIFGQLNAIVLLMGLLGISLLGVLLVSSKFLQLTGPDRQFLIAAVLILLAFITIPLILFAPFPETTTHFPNGTIVTHADITQQDRLSTFTSVMAIVGVWVGAVVAFYFGSENLNAATKSITALVQGPRALLESQLVRDKMRDKFAQLKMGDSLDKAKETLATLKAQGHYTFFVVVIDDAGKLLHVIDRELIDGFEHSTLQVRSDAAPTTSIQAALGEISTKQLKDVVGPTTQKPQDGLDEYVKARSSETLSIVQERLDSHKFFLAIVVDDQDKPLGYLTTNDVRKALLGSS